MPLGLQRESIRAHRAQQVDFGTPCLRSGARPLDESDRDRDDRGGGTMTAASISKQSDRENRDRHGKSMNQQTEGGLDPPRPVRAGQVSPVYLTRLPFSSETLRSAL